MQKKSIEAIILGRKNWGEADRLVFAYTKEEGKIKFIAKGSRKIKSKMACHIEPFTIGKYNLLMGKNFPILVGAESSEQNINLTKNLATYKKAAYLIELLDISSEEGVANNNIYIYAKKILLLLNKVDECKQNILISFFEYLILESSGYKPNYACCKKCGISINECDYYFGSFEGVYCVNCNKDGVKISKNVYKILRIFESKNINKIISIKDINIYEKEISEVIYNYLYDILPKIPKSKII